MRVLEYRAVGKKFGTITLFPKGLDEKCFFDKSSIRRVSSRAPVHSLTRFCKRRLLPAGSSLPSDFIQGDVGVPSTSHPTTDWLLNNDRRLNNHMNWNRQYFKVDMRQD
jgi:hypothetical protein